MAASAYHVKSMEAENQIFKTIEFLDTSVFIINRHWQSSGILIFFCKYYIVLSDTLVGFFLDVLFLLLAVILLELHEKQRRKDWVTKKVTFFDCTLSFLCIFVASFFVYALPITKWSTCAMAVVKIHILLWMVYCVIIS